MTESNETMRSKVTLLIVGFILTSVLGSWVASRIQDKTWHSQWVATQQQRNFERKTDTFKSISRLLDERLFRSRQLVWAFQPRFEDQEVERRFALYRDVFEEWNLNLNRNLALIEIDFGEKLRYEFEHEVGRMLTEAGARVEKMYRAHQKAEDVDISGLSEKLNSINLHVYQFNLSMLRSLKNEQWSKDG